MIMISEPRIQQTMDEASCDRCDGAAVNDGLENCADGVVGSAAVVEGSIAVGLE
jgi:hypothetical protein